MTLPATELTCQVPLEPGHSDMSDHSHSSAKPAPARPRAAAPGRGGPPAAPPTATPLTPPPDPTQGAGRPLWEGQRRGRGSPARPRPQLCFSELHPSLGNSGHPGFPPACTQPCPGGERAGGQLSPPLSLGRSTAGQSTPSPRLALLHPGPRRARADSRASCLPAHPTQPAAACQPISSPGP